MAQSTHAEAMAKSEKEGGVSGGVAVIGKMLKSVGGGARFFGGARAAIPIRRNVFAPSPGRIIARLPFYCAAPVFV